MRDEHVATIASLRRYVRQLEQRLAASIDDDQSLERDLRTARRWLKERIAESRATTGGNN